VPVSDVVLVLWVYLAPLKSDGRRAAERLRRSSCRCRRYGEAERHRRGQQSAPCVRRPHSSPPVCEHGSTGSDLVLLAVFAPMCATDPGRLPDRQAEPADIRNRSRSTTR
jgi:hypothetical protein